MVKRWYRESWNAFKRHKIRNSISLILSLFLIYIIGHFLFFWFGLVPLLFYIAFYIYNIRRVFEKPYRTAVWGVGAGLTALAIGYFLDVFFNRGAEAVSSFYGIIIFYLMVYVFIKGRRLKKY